MRSSSYGNEKVEHIQQLFQAVEPGNCLGVGHQRREESKIASLSEEDTGSNHDQNG